MLVHFDGTHDGPYAGIPASGQTIALDMFAIVTFDDTGKAIAERVFLDTADITTTLNS